MAEGRKGRKQQARQEDDLEEVQSEVAYNGEQDMAGLIKTLMAQQRMADLDREDRKEEAKRVEDERVENLRVKRETEAREHMAQLQKEAEERQFQQQVQLLRLQREMGDTAGKDHREAASRERKQDRALSNIACCSDEDDLEDYLMMVERRLEAANVKKEEWVDVVESKFKGRLAISWQDAVASTGGYQEARDRILKSNGYTPRVAADKFFSWKVEQTGGLTVDQLYQMGQQLSRRMLAPGKLSEELEFSLVKGWLGTVIPRQARAAMDARSSENSAELITVLQDYLALGGDGKSATFKKYSGGSHVVKDVTSSRPWQPACFKCGKVGHKAADCWGGGSAVPRSDGAPVAGGSHKIICHTCGVEGHKSPQCPRRGKNNEHSADAKPKPVRQVSRKGKRSGQARVAGTVDGQETLILLDSATDISVVPATLVKEGQVVEEQVLVQAFGDSPAMWLPTADVEFTLGENQWSERVAVTPEGEEASKEVLLSLDLRSQRGIQIILWANRDRVQIVEKKEAVKVAKIVTMSQAREEKEKEDFVIEVTPVVAALVEKPIVSDGRAVIHEPGTREVQVDLPESFEVEEGWPDLGDLAVKEEDVSFDLMVDGSCEDNIIVPPVKAGTLARAALVAEACELKRDEILDGFIDLFAEEEIVDEEDEILDGLSNLFAEEEILVVEKEIVEEEEEILVGFADLFSEEETLGDLKVLVDVVLENDEVLDSLVDLVAEDAEEIVSVLYDSSVGEDSMVLEKEILCFVDEDYDDTLCFGKDSSDDEKEDEAVAVIKSEVETDVEKAEVEIVKAKVEIVEVEIGAKVESIVEAEAEKVKTGKVESKVDVDEVDVEIVEVEIGAKVESKVKIEAKVEADSAVGDIRSAEVKVEIVEEIVKVETLGVRKWYKVKDEYFDFEVWLEELKKELPGVITAGPGRIRFGMPKIKGQPRACLGSAEFVWKFLVEFGWKFLVEFGWKFLVEFVLKFGAELAGKFVFLVAWKFIMEFAWKLVFMVAWKWLFMIVWKMVVESAMRLMFEFQEIFFLPTSATSNSAPSVVVWDGARLKAFTTLKGMLCDVCSLTIPSSEDVFVLNTDASGLGIGATLNVIRDGVEKPVAFFSRQLQGAQKHYTATELEGLAVFKAIFFFDHFLYGRKFVVNTDHQALVSLLKSKRLNRRLHGWVLKLLDFHFEIVYRPGRCNGDADGLSRQAWCNLEEEDSEEHEQLRTAVVFPVGGDVGTEPHRSRVATSGVALRPSEVKAVCKSSVQEPRVVCKTSVQGESHYLTNT